MLLYYIFNYIIFLKAKPKLNIRIIKIRTFALRSRNSKQDIDKKKKRQ